MRLHSSTRATVAAVLLGCSLASAQSTEQLVGFDLERLDTNLGRGTLLVGNGELMARGGMSVSLLGHYQRLPLVLSDGVTEVQVVRDRATGLLSASYGVLSWLELGAQVPFVLWQQGDDPTAVGISPLTAQGIGTPMLQARLGLLSRRQLQPVDLSADLGVGLPVGTGSALAGDAGPRVHARLVAGTVLGKVQPSLEAGVLFRPSVQLDTADSEAKTGASSEIRLGASVATTGEGLRGELGLRTTIASPNVSMELIGGVRFPLPAGLEAFVQGGPGLGGAPGTPRFRVLAGVSFRKEPEPPITYLEREADRALQIELAQHQLQRAENPVRPVSTQDLYATREEGQSFNGTLEEAKRPYQPGPNERIVMRGEIHFAQGSTALQGVVPLLDQTVLRLSELPAGATILIEGHADDEGTDMGRARLSMQRAQMVRRYLLDQNVPWTQVQTRGFGSEWPVSTNPTTDQERQLNRRVEVLVVIKTEAPITTQAPVP